MRSEKSRATLRCAVYTRVSTEHGLEQEFNSLDNQREASEAYVKSQAHEGWKLIRNQYDDSGYSSGSMERPSLPMRLRLPRSSSHLSPPPRAPTGSRGERLADW